MDKVKNIIYKAKNEQRKCFYIGSSVRGLSNRKHRHKRDCYEGNKNFKFYRFLRKYGWDSFTWEVLAVYPTKEELPNEETQWISDQKKEFSDWECLNLTDGSAGGNTWALLSEERKKEIKIKLSDIQRKRYEKKEERQKTGEYSKEVWRREGYKEKMSEIAKRVQNTPERLLLNRQQSTGRIGSGMSGRRHKEETKRIMSEKRKKYWSTRLNQYIKYDK